MNQDARRLIQQAFQARRENRPEDAKRDLMEAVELCRQAGPRQELATALVALGQIERDMHSNDAALLFYQEAIAIYRAEGQALKLAHAIRHVGDIQRHETRYEFADAAYAEALTLYRKHPEASRLDLANALRGMAILKQQTGRTQEARALWQEAGDLYAAVDVAAGVAESARRLKELAGQTTL